MPHRIDIDSIHEDVFLHRSVLRQGMDVAQPALQRRLLVERATGPRLVAGVDDPRGRFYDPGDRREHAGEERRVDRTGVRRACARAHEKRRPWERAEQRAGFCHRRKIATTISGLA